MEKSVVTISGLVLFLLGLRGATFATIATETFPRLRRKNPWGKVRKVAVTNGQLNFHYDAAVRRRLANEGKDPAGFVQGQSWHEPFRRRADGTLTPLAAKKGGGEPNYLRFRYLKTVEPSLYLTQDGGVLETAAVLPYLESRETAYANQGTDDPVVILTYGLSSLREVRTEGRVLIVEG